MPRSRTKLENHVLRAFAVARPDDCDHDREEQSRDGRCSGGDGDRHVEAAPVKPGGAGGDGRARAPDKGAEKLIVLAEAVGPDNLSEQQARGDENPSDECQK